MNTMQALVKKKAEPGLWLEGLGSKTTLAPLAAFLMNPAKTDPDGRMPSLLLSQDEALQIAAFLLESRNDAFEKPAPTGDDVPDALWTSSLLPAFSSSAAAAD